MESIRNLLSRVGSSGILFVAGFLLIIYIGLGFVYWQQGPQKEELEEQIARLSIVLSRPALSGEELQADYEAANRALAQMPDEYALFNILVDIAEKNGIDVTPDAGNLLIPSYTTSTATVGGGTYQVLSFSNVRVQGDDDNVTALISDLDSGESLETLVLKRVAFSQVEIRWEDGDRRVEFSNVLSAMRAMIDDNGLSAIPNPMSFAGGVATNLMGDDPDTEGTVEGFPDITTTADGKGYTGTGSPRDGYVLYGHDKVPADNTTQFETIDYITTLTTNYYYTCEADGTVRQFDGADVVTATEHLGSEEFKTEAIVFVDVDIYTKLEE